MKKLKLGLLLLTAVLALALMLSLSSCKKENNPPDDGTSNSDSATDTEPGIVPAKKEGKVIFMDEDGTLLETVTGEVGSAISYTPAKKGYKSFAYYADAELAAPSTLANTIPEGETTVYVKWTSPIKYTLVFDAGRGVGVMNSVSATYDEKITLPANTFFLKNETFTEWRVYGANGSYEAYIDGARVRNLTDTDGAEVKLVAVFANPDAANFTVKDGTVTSYTGSEKHVIFPATATKISADVFANNPAAEKITKITVPNTYETIEKGAFAPCKALAELSVPFIGGSRTENSFIAYLFGASSYLDNDYSFEAEANPLYGLQRQNEDFSKQLVPTTLKKVTVTDTIYQIAEGAFYKMFGLEKLVVSDYEKLYKIGKSAFEGCWQLGYDSTFEIQNPLYWLENVETIEDGAFKAYGSKQNSEGKSYVFTRIFELPKLAKIETIGKEAFYGCVYILNLEFGPNLKTIGAYAFTNSASITKLTLPDSLTDIGEWAFTSCMSLTELNIGKNVRSIGAFAFADCTALGSVNIAAPSPARTALIPFSNGIDYKYNAQGAIEGYTPTFTYLKIYVSGESLNSYKGAWVDYTACLEGKDTAVEKVIYYNKRSDGTYSARLKIVGNVIYVEDPFGELLNNLDIFKTTEDLGTEYTLLYRALGKDEVVAVGSEEFYELSNTKILDYMGDELKTTVRVRPEVYEKDGVKYLIPTLEFLGGHGTIGDGADSLYKIEEDDFGHATLYKRTRSSAAWTKDTAPAGTVYTELYLYVSLVYDEQYLAVVYQNENGEPIEYKYFFTLGKTLVPASSEKTSTALTFLSYGDVQITIDGAGTAKLTYFANRETVGYVGKYELAKGKPGDASFTVEFKDLAGEGGKTISGTATFDGYFDESYHRCKVVLRQNGATIYNNTVYTSAHLEVERYCLNDANNTEYCFYDYVSEDGKTTFRYVEYINAEKISSHGTYSIDGDKITINVDSYAEVVGKITDVRLSFTIPGALGDSVYTTYGYDEDYTFYMSESFYGTTIDYYTIKMDGYGNATLHDEHTDDIDVYYKGTYYNTGRSIGEDAYGKFWVYCFTGVECDENGNIKVNGETATYYYVTGTEIYEYSDSIGSYYGEIVSISLSAGSEKHDVYDEKGIKFATMDVDPFGITEITLLDHTFENGEIVYTENKELSEKLACTAYIGNDGNLACVVVLDKAGNFMFCVSPDDDGEWLYTYEHKLDPKDGESEDIIPDLENSKVIAQPGK